jgi:glucose/arabinose dehydrogenase
MRDRSIPIWALLIASLIGWLQLQPVAAQEAVLLDPEAVDAGLVLTEVAADLAFPMGMIGLPDRSLLVATSPPHAGNFYASGGELLRLADSNGDGTLDDRRVLAGNMPGSLVAIARHGEIVIVTSAQAGGELIMFFRRGERWRDPLLPIEAINLHFRGALHQSYSLATRTNPDDPDSFDLIFNIGAGGNETAGEPVDFDGITSGTLQPASLYLMTVIDHGAEIEFGDPVQVASGLRNASALAFHPETGDLWIGENGIDGLTNPIEAFSADELDVIPAGQIGTSVVDFGFPNSYVDYGSGEVVGEEPPAVAFLPVDGDEAEGIAGITFVPESFPEEYAGGILAGFHGQFDLIGLENEENPVRWVDPDTGEQWTLISNDSPGVGHLDSMTATDEAIYLADFCVASMSSSTGCGVIYLLAAS